jgi:hypothetical protein
MPLLSNFTPCGLLMFSGDPPVAEQIYNQSVEALGGQYRLDEGDHMEGKTYAASLGVARAVWAMRVAAAQDDPEYADAGLPTLEWLYKLTPGPHDTIDERRAAVAQRQRRSVGSNEVAVVAALTALLGDAFVNFRTLRPDEVTRYPADPGAGPGVFSDPNFALRGYRMIDSVALLGAPVTFRYAQASLYGKGYAAGGDNATRLEAGMPVSIELGSNWRHEKVTITAVSEGSDYPRATAVFAKAHPAGGTVLTGPTPYWASTQRHVLVVLKYAAANDPLIRAQVNDEMRRLLNGTTTWGVVAQDPDAPDYILQATTSTPLGLAVAGHVTVF